MDLLLIIKYAAIISFGTLFLIVILAFLFSRSKKNETEEAAYTPQIIDNTVYYAEQNVVFQNGYNRQYQNSDLHRTSYHMPTYFNSTKKVNFPHINRPVRQPKFVVIKDL